MENQPKEDITLEKVLESRFETIPRQISFFLQVVRDMAHVFYNLKNGISLVKSSISMQRTDKESTHNMENELEKLYQRQEMLNKEKAREAAQKAKDQARKKMPPQSPALIKKDNVNKKASKNQARPLSEPVKNLVVTNVQFPLEHQKNRAVSPGIKAPR